MPPGGWRLSAVRKSDQIAHFEGPVGSRDIRPWFPERILVQVGVMVLPDQADKHFCDDASAYRSEVMATSWVRILEGIAPGDFGFPKNVEPQGRVLLELGKVCKDLLASPVEILIVGV